MKFYVGGKRKLDGGSVLYMGEIKPLRVSFSNMTIMDKFFEMNFRLQVK